ncbi:MAG: FAD-binding oxidoreductase, partial [Planctomycetales bacterium]|nr:FAD-binding oxidoreductase [Planctomycetales bacterium]
MDQERERVQADLRGLLEGEIRCDDAFLQMYSSDASIFEIKPLGVVRPRNTADVVACVQYASENQLPIHARGAGTGLAGESLGRGLVLDFSHAMRRILQVDANSVTAQPGVILGRLNEQLAAQGRCFGPDPANRAVTTIGSVVAIDAGGSHWLRYGSARRHVKSLKVVLANGETLTVGQHSWQESLHRTDTLSMLVQRVGQLIQSNSGLITQYRSHAPIDRSGYRLDDVVVGDQVDLARLLVGSEGTLALFTEATLATEPLPRHR